MKDDVKDILKEKGKIDLFSDLRYYKVKNAMEYGMTKDAWLKNYLSLDPLNKAQWIADHLIKFVEAGQI
jgi:hypothetical protein